MSELLVEAEKNQIPVAESYLRWDNLHLCLLWCLLSRPSGIRELEECVELSLSPVQVL